MRAFFIAALLALVSHVASADDLTGTLKKIKDNNRFVIGVRDAAPPFSFVDQNQNIVGYSIDICKNIVEAVKDKVHSETLEVVYLPVTSSTRLPLTMNGTVDMECGSTTNNAERQKIVSFTNAHFLTANRYVYKKTQKIESIKDLKGKAVSSVAGSVNIAQLNKINTDLNLGMTIMSAKDVVEGFLLLETDRVAAFVMDDVQLSVMVALSKNPDLYSISTEALSMPEPYGFILRKNDPEFKSVVDGATAKLYRSPEMEKIYVKWFESPIPPRGINYKYPMPDVVRKAFARPSDSADPTSYDY